MAGQRIFNTVRDVEVAGKEQYQETVPSTADDAATSLINDADYRKLSPSELISNLVVDGKMEIPDALAKVESYYNGQDIRVKNLPGIDDFANTYFNQNPLKRAALAASFALTRPVLRQAGRPFGISPERVDEALGQQDELTPSGPAKTLGWIGGEFAKYGAAAGVVAPLVEGVTAPLAAIGGGYKTKAALDFAGRSIDAGAGAAIVGGAEGRDPLREFEWGAGLYGVGSILGAGILKLIGKNPVFDRAVRFVAQSEGIAPEEAANRLQTVGKTVAALHEKNAPIELIDEVTQAVQQEGFESAQQVKPIELTDIQPTSPLGYGFEKPETPNLSNAFGFTKEEVPQLKGQFADLPALDLPSKAPKTVKTQGYDLGNGKYSGITSTRANEQIGMGLTPSNLELSKPLVVDYDPSKETATTAALKALYRDDSQRATVEAMINGPLMPPETQLYNKFVEELAKRKAHERGYKSIIARGVEPRDDFIFDLKGFKPTEYGTVKPKLELTPGLYGGAKIVSERVNISQVENKIRETLRNQIIQDGRPGGENKQTAKLNAAITATLALGAGAGLLVDPNTSEAAMLNLNNIEKIAAENGHSLVSELTPYIDQAADMTLSYVASHLGSEEIPSVIGLLRDVINRVSQPGGKLRFQQSVDGLNGAIIKLWHDKVPEFPILKAYGRFVPESGELFVKGTDDYTKNVFKVDVLDGIGAGQLGAGQLKTILRGFKQMNPETQEILSGSRATGVQEKKGGVRFSRILLGSGALASLYTLMGPDEAHASVAEDLVEHSAKTAISKMLKEGSIDEAFAKKLISNPIELFPDSMKEAIGGEALSLKSDFMHMLRPLAQASDQSDYMVWAKQIYKAQEDWIFGVANRLFDGLKQVTDEYPVGKVDASRIKDVVKDIRVDPITLKKSFSGAVKDITPEEKVAARRLRKITDSIYTYKTGIDPKAPIVLQHLGVPENQANWELLKQIQDVRANAPDPLTAAAQVGQLVGNRGRSYEIAATRTEGMLNFDPTHNLDIKYSDGYFPDSPVEGEIRRIKEELTHLDKQYGNSPPIDIQSKQQAYNDRLQYLQNKEAEFIKSAKNPSTHLPTHAGAEIFNEGVPLEGGIYKKGLADIYHDYISDAVYSRRADLNLHHTNIAEQAIRAKMAGMVDPEKVNDAENLIGYMKDWTRVMRGARVNEDLWLKSIVNWVRRAGGKEGIDLDELRNGMRYITHLTVVSKLFSGLRFPLVNLTQPLMTTSGPVGFESLMKGYFKAFQPSAWVNPDLKDILRPEHGIMADLESVTGQMYNKSTLLSWLPNKTENFNKVVSYYAALDQFYKVAKQEGKLFGLSSSVNKLPKAFSRTFVFDKNAPLDRLAHQWAVNIVNATQFQAGVVSRPQFWTGSAVRGNVGTFKTFGTNYVNLVQNSYQHMKDTKDPMPLARMLLGLGFFGGLPAIAGSVPFLPVWDQVRSRLPWLPDKTGARVLWEHLGLAEPMHVPVLEEIRNTLDGVDVSSSFDPWSLPRFRQDSRYINSSPGILNNFMADAMAWGLGPTVLSGAGIGEKVFGKYMMPDTGNLISKRDDISALSKWLSKAEDVGRMVGVGNAIESARIHFGQNDIEYSPSGEPIAHPSTAQLWRRVFNVQPSLVTIRNNLLKNLRNAILQDHQELIPVIMDEFTRNHLYLTDKARRRLYSETLKKRAQ